MHAARLTTFAFVLLIITPSIAVLHPASAIITPNPGLNINLTSFQRWDSDSSTNFLPAVVQRLDGTVQVFWEFINTVGGRPSNPTINYRTTSSPGPVYNASKWSASQTLVSVPTAQNIAPSVSQARNGTLYLTYGSNRTGNFDIFLKRYSPGPGWYPDLQVTLNATFAEKASSTVAASDGSLWLFWDRTLSPTSSGIYYKVWQNGVWSTVAPITTDGSTIQNVQPYAFQTLDGTIWVVYSRDDTGSNLTNLYYKTFRNGVWSSAVQLTSTSNPDFHPEIFQDQNNTIWVAWNRELPVTSTVFQNDIFYTYSINNGASFVPELNLTNDVGCSTPCSEDIQPSFAQLKDGRVYLFWASNRDSQSYWNLFYATTSPMPFHHIAVTALSAGPVLLRMGDVPVTINVTVANLGTFPETFWLFIKAVNTTALTVALQYLAVGANQTMPLSIIWNTNGMRPAKYTMTAYVVPSQSENQIVTGDNTIVAGREWLVPPGDVDYDGTDDVSDLGIVALAYHSTPGSPNWNPQADLNHEGSVGIDDLATVALWYHTYT